MKFNPTILEILVFVLGCLIIFIWTKHGRQIRRWLQDCFRQRRGPCQLKPKSPHDCPACNQLLSLWPFRPQPDVVPWCERKSPRGRPKIIDSNGFACLNLCCDYFAIADGQIHAPVSNGRRGKQKIRYWKCQACALSLVSARFTTVICAGRGLVRPFSDYGGLPIAQIQAENRASSVSDWAEN